MTFIFGADGTVRKTYEKVDVLGHAERVLAEVVAFTSERHSAGE
jgi:peroxiredoxin